MSGILNQLRSIAVDLKKLQTEWALIGGLAVSVYTEPRN
jgi:hypothetical protein